jgi:hypothetical protein
VQISSAIWGDYVWHGQKLKDESWEAEMSIENRAPVDPLLFSLEKTSKEERNSDDLPVCDWVNGLRISG